MYLTDSMGYYLVEAAPYSVYCIRNENILQGISEKYNKNSQLVEKVNAMLTREIFLESLNA